MPPPFYHDLLLEFIVIKEGFPDSSVGKKFAHNARDPRSIPGWEDLLEKG